MHAHPGVENFLREFVFVTSHGLDVLKCLSFSNMTIHRTHAQTDVGIAFFMSLRMLGDTWPNLICEFVTGVS